MVAVREIRKCNPAPLRFKRRLLLCGSLPIKGEWLAESCTRDESQPVFLCHFVLIEAYDEHPADWVPLEFSAAPIASTPIPPVLPLQVAIVLFLRLPRFGSLHKQLSTTHPMQRYWQLAYQNQETRL